MSERLVRQVRRCTLVALVFLAGCGGGGGSDPAPVAAAPATVGVDGGTVSAEGVKLVIPAGAMSADTTIRIAKDSTGAPTLPQWAQAAGDMLAITPHGSEFSEPVTVRVPVPNVTLQANQKLFIAKAQPGGEWQVLGETVQKDGLLEARVQSFSFFTAVIVTFLPPTGPLASFLAFELSSVTLECNGVPCVMPELVRPMTLTVTVTNNGGQLPANCVNPRIQLRDDRALIGTRVNAEPGVVIRRDLEMPPLTDRMISERKWRVYGELECTDTATNVVSRLLSKSTDLYLVAGSKTRSTPQVVQFPAQLTQAVGDTPTIRAVMTGGAANITSAYSTSVTVAVPTGSDEAVVFLERLAPTENVWRTVATSNQSTANPSPFAGSRAPAWLYWSFDYALEPLTTADNGAVYRMRVCYALPAATQLSCAVGPTARMTVVQHILIPTYSQQPQSMLVTPGQTASFSVVAGGAPAPTLQWQTRPANSTGDWANVSPSSSATTANYTTPAIGLADNGVQYRVLATNAAGSTASQAVIVSVTAAAEAPSIVSEPVGLTVVTGSEAVLAVSAKGTGALSYQWWRQNPDINVNRGADTLIVGANGAQLKISNTTSGDAGLYRVSVSNAVDAVYSNWVSVTVSDGNSAPVAPSIVTQPAAVAVTEGNVATFAVGVSGSGPLSFQWRKNGVDIAGATAAAYTLPAVAAADAGTYSVLVTNSAGSMASQAATLAVSAALVSPPAVPTIVAQPGTLVVAPGMSAMFGVGVQGSGSLSYQWLRDGIVVAGQTSAIYSIASASALDAGTYQVRVSNSAGTVTSASSQLILLGAPVITAQPVAVATTEGAAATFGITATGDALRYQWVRNGVAIAGANTASHTTPATTLGDSGAVYAVIVYNGAGLLFSQSAVLTVTASSVVQATTLASVSSAAVLANHTSSAPSLSADGRLVAFTSLATNLVPGVASTPTSGSHAYLRNLATGVTSLINQTPAGAPSSQGVFEMKLAAGGRHVVFTSLAGDLVAGDDNGSMDLFVRDLQTGITTRINVLPDGSQITGAGSSVGNLSASISADGRWVSFVYQLDLLDAGQSLPTNALYLRDRQSGATRLVGSSPAYAIGPALISNDASRIVYIYALANQNVLSSYEVEPADTITLLSVDTSVFPSGIGNSLSLSDSGRFVAFTIRSAAWIPGAAAAFNQAVVLDHNNPGVLTGASFGGDAFGDGHSAYPVLSGDGRFVLFSTNSPGLSGDPAATVRPYLMVRDLVEQTTRVASRRPNNTAVWVSPSAHGMHALSADGAVLGLSADRFDMTGDAGGVQVYVAPRP